MKFKEKSKDKIEDKNENNEIEIIMGDDSELDISGVGDCMNELRPKDMDKKKKSIVIPKTKNK